MELYRIMRSGKRNARCITLSVLLLFGISLDGQEKLDTIALENIQIQATQIPTILEFTPLSLSVVKEIDQKQFFAKNSIQEFLQTQSGVFNLNELNHAQDLRISIRGFGARASFGIRGIKLIVDGVPETTPDGQGQIDNLELDNINTIEIIKGPSSGLYGNASGGVIQLSSNFDVDKNFIQSRTLIGQYGMFKQNIQIGIRDQKSSLILSGNLFSTDGYRMHARSRSDLFSLRYQYRLSPVFKIRFSANYLNSPYAEDPGGINLDSVQEDRRSARTNNVNFNAGEAIQHFKSFASLSYVSDSKKFESKVYYHKRAFDGRLPFANGGVIDLNRDFFGNSSHLSFYNDQEKMHNKLLLGYDLQFQSDKRLRFVNQDGEAGEKTLEQTESFNNYAIFLVDHFKLDNELDVHFDLRYDFNQLSVADDFLEDRDDSGNIDYQAINYGLGLGLSKWKDYYPFVRLSSSFETPTLSELSANPMGGGFNQDLDPIRSTNYELGFRWTREQFSFSSSLFYINSSNEIVAFELEDFPGRDFFRNAGRTQRIGFELDTQFQKGDNYVIQANYSFSQFQFAEFIVNGLDFNGNQLPGLPMHQFNLNISYTLPFQTKLNLIHQLNGQLFADDSNSVLIDSYQRTDLRFDKSLMVQNRRFGIFGGINNLFNQAYFDNVRINAFGGRYYEPAPGINYYLGLYFKIQRP